MKDFIDEHWFWASPALFFLIVILLMGFEKYLNHSRDMEAIKAGLMQDKDGRWVKP